MFYKKVEKRAKQQKRQETLGAEKQKKNTNTQNVESTTGRLKMFIISFIPFFGNVLSISLQSLKKTLIRFDFLQLLQRFTMFNQINEKIQTVNDTSNSNSL